MKKYLIEGIGTFFLVVTAAFTGNPVAIGGILAALVYMGSSVSGGQYNPAVSLALWKIGKLSRDEFFKYSVSQLAGSLLATLLYGFLHGETFVVQPASGSPFWAALVAEAVFTFALVLVVLQTAVSEKTKGNSYFGAAIGLTVMAGAFAVGGISGGAFNPAVGIGPQIINIATANTALSSLVLYSIGPSLGALAAAGVFRISES